MYVKSKAGGDELSDSDSDDEEEGTSNRVNPALSRQKKKNKNGKVRRKYGNSLLVEGTDGGGDRIVATVRTMRIKVSNSSINS